MQGRSIGYRFPVKHVVDLIRVTRDKSCQASTYQLLYHDSNHLLVFHGSSTLATLVIQIQILARSSWVPKDGIVHNDDIIF